MTRFTLFLSSLVVLAGGVAQAEANEGKAIFESHCAACHQKDGIGLKGVFPPLRDSAAMKNADFVISVVLKGLTSHISVNGVSYHGVMPEWRDQLSDAQIAAVVTYVRASLNSYDAVTQEEVAKVKSSRKTPEQLVAARGTGEVAAAATETNTSKDSNAASIGSKPLNSAALKDALKGLKYVPPLPSDVEKLTGQFGEFVKLGFLIFSDTQNYAKSFIRSGLNCSSCHLAAGTLAGSAPMWGAFPMYPTYRGKNNLVNSFENRLQGCFIYSMNGVAPEAGSSEMEALAAYSAWMSEALPVGVAVEGRGYPSVKNFKDPDKTRGADLYAQKCAICHGDEGQGIKALGTQVGYQFPPLWGPDSYNWGAGMHSEKNFRNFIKGNMPLGQGGTLSDQGAADIAAYVNQTSHARPTRLNSPGQAPDF